MTCKKILIYMENVVMSLQVGMIEASFAQRPSELACFSIT